MPKKKIKRGSMEGTDKGMSGECRVKRGWGRGGGKEGYIL
jgi:hypothetical protein